MNETIAKNIREHRTRRAWTQEHLAGAARVTARTVQRAEEGRGMSAETLQAIAGALDVSIDELRLDFHEVLARLLGVSPSELTPELIEQKAAEVAGSYDTIPLSIVTTSAQFRCLDDAKAMMFECLVEKDEVQDVAAELKQDMRDVIDIRDEADAVNVREFDKGLFALVKRLNELGCVLCLGGGRASMQLGGIDVSDWHVVYALVCPAEEPRRVAMVEKGAALRGL